MITLSPAAVPRLLRSGLVVLAVLFASGCASTHPYNPRDPLQGYNRAVFAFNDTLDSYIVKPVAQGYRFVVPSIVRSGVGNFFSNLEDVWIGANNLMQGKVEAGLGDWMRFVINSTFGLGGVLDVASEARLPKNNEDFGQTLGWWGVGSGPYFVLPFLGPSTIRDTAALPFDYTASNALRGPIARGISENSATGILTSAWVLNLTNTRANLLEAGNLLEQAALDRYAFLRDAFLQRRRNLVYDGNPPKEKEEDDDAQAPSLTPLAISVPIVTDGTIDAERDAAVSLTAPPRVNVSVVPPNGEE